MAENNSKDLLKLEADAPSSSSSSLESKLFVCKKDSSFSVSDAPPQTKPTMLPLPKSQFLGKVKDFLGVISESNKKLLEDAKENPEKYDMEVLSGNESKFIEMDLMLGIADLHTPEAVAAAESAMAGRPPVINLSDSNDSSSDDDDEAGPQSVKSESEDAVRDTTTASCNGSRKKKPKKKTKIVELS
ncbi:hypothetical protein ABFS82_13G004600 [Erythranthe guttata]|uniref:Uncharacterized protein n=2 Tax=Erythranthe guttata TaxID=4155 RepID=A0A022RRZ3_ERYGU|nr:PREDICTED: uncharacterized protein LOC105951917 [Erythranthe guttata]EYU42771.1 hypothetical protein MIMGU_mgv1a014553mg [Erythranthe guttata]|eukprot:XP_012830851.1 PREDICTED: uncharacterized protein LOC105951917 [Erythranthe guttata]